MHKLLGFAETGAHLETSRLSYQFGEFTLDVSRGCVLKAGEEIKLRPKVYETLKYLVENHGRLDSGWLPGPCWASIPLFCG